MFLGMIAFEELVAALDRWRVRNGMPVVTGDVPTVAVASAPAPAPAAWSPPAAPAWAAAPAAAAAPVGEVSDVVALDDDVLEEEHYDNEGDDFAMAFGAPAADPEATASGPVPTTSAPAMPAYDDSAAPAYDAYGQPGSGPYAADPYAQGGSGGYAAVPPEADPAYDDPAYDPPAAGYDQAYAPPTGDTIDAEADADVIEEDATQVGDGLPKR